MASKRALLEMLERQIFNRAEQVRIHRAYRNPNAQLLGRLETEHKMFEEVKRIVEASDLAPAPTTTSDDSERERLGVLADPHASTSKRLVSRETLVGGEHDPSLARGTLEADVKTFPSGKRIGRPPKMTRAQIQAANKGPIGVALNDRD